MMVAGTQAEELIALIRRMGAVVVALSGGVDSSVVAFAAFAALGDDALAVTADSPSVARRDLTDAQRLAGEIGIRHRIIRTDEFANPDYLKNAGDRCYYCKSSLYDHLLALRRELGEVTIVSGANLDDAGDYRPGLTAAAERGIRHPLQELKLTKADVRTIARHWGLTVSDKPASPCLSSRIAPGVAVTVERTARVEAAEAWLHEHGWDVCRVRLHDGELARVEVPAATLPRLVELRNSLTRHLHQLGFRFVTIDLDGFQSGSLNQLVTLETRRHYEVRP